MKKTKATEKRTIFIAYNTDSIVWELTLRKSNKYGRLSDGIQKNDEIKNLMEEVYTEKGTSYADVDTISDNNDILRKKVFQAIKEYLTTSNRQQTTDGYIVADNTYKNVSYNYYMDILDESWQTQKLITHYTKNKQTIKQSDGLLFVIADEETSFWQLQEAYFASFYNKPIMYIKTQQFLKCVADHTLHKFIGKKWQRNSYYTGRYHPSPAQRSK